MTATTCVAYDLVRDLNSITQFSNFILRMVTLDGRSSYKNITRFQDSNVSNIFYTFCINDPKILNKKIMGGGGKVARNVSKFNVLKCNLNVFLSYLR